MSKLVKEKRSHLRAISYRFDLTLCRKKDLQTWEERSILNMKESLYSIIQNIYS